MSHIPEALRRRIVGLGGAILAIEEEGVSGSRGKAQWSIVETQGVLAAWFRHNGLLAALVRPDHYVFAIARQPSDLQIAICSTSGFSSRAESTAAPLSRTFNHCCPGADLRH